MEYKGSEYKGMKYTIQVRPEDCTGCGLCVEICPAKSKSEVKTKAINMQPQAPLREIQKANWDFFLNIPEIDRRTVKMDNVKGSQLLQPLFEYSGSVFRMRRNSVPETCNTIVRRPDDCRKCDRLLIDLWRQSSDDALDKRFCR